MSLDLDPIKHQRAKGGNRDGLLEEYDNQQALLAQRGRKP